MSGAADDDSAPSNSTPQSPEGVEGAPDVTVTESKPDTPGSNREEDSTSRSELKNETPTEQPSENVELPKEENVEPAKEETAVTNDESKTDVGDGRAEIEEQKPAGGESVQNTSEESPSAVEEERIGNPAPETGETEPIKREDAKLSGEDNEAPSSENEKGETGETKQDDKPTKEASETEYVAVTNESTKEKENANEAGSVGKTKSENECENINEIGGNESSNTNDNNDVAEGATQSTQAEPSTDFPESNTREMIPKEGDIPPESKALVVDELNTTSAAKVAQSERVENKHGECTEENPTSTNPDDRANSLNVGGGNTPSNPEENAEHENVEISEIDSLKLENERLEKRVKELEDEMDGIKEGRKEGMKVQADYLARELSQQQDTEKYLREKLTEVLQEKEESERRVKDLQLRLKRFAKDDQAKDARLAKMEKELQEVTHEIQVLENVLDADTLRSVQEQRRSGKVNGPSGAGTERNKGTLQPPPPQSKTCVIL